MVSIKSLLMISFVALNAITCQLLLKRGLVMIQAEQLLRKSFFLFLQEAFLSPVILLAFGLQAVGYIVWLLVITKTKLGLAFALSSAFFYIPLALSGWLFFGERLTSVQWLGIATITIGVLLISWPPR